MSVSLCRLARSGRREKRAVLLSDAHRGKKVSGLRARISEALEFFYPRARELLLWDPRGFDAESRESWYLWIGELDDRRVLRVARAGSNPGEMMIGARG